MGSNQARKQLELDQTLVQALKLRSYPEALQVAKKVLEISPNHQKAREFKALLEELCAGKDGRASEGVAQDGSDSDESDTSDEDDESEDQDAPGAPTDEAQDPAVDSEDYEEVDEENEEVHQSEVDAAALRMSALSLTAGQLRMPPAKRCELRKSLADGIKAVKQKELHMTAVQSDPLLSA